MGAPQLEGLIWLKADSKKSWKKFYFVLRSSGLYYAPKGKKMSRDLICLTTFDVNQVIIISIITCIIINIIFINQVYYGVGWRKKYKAPTDYCFAIKHPQIQAKNPKYIRYDFFLYNIFLYFTLYISFNTRYMCLDSQKELHQWVTGIRIAKNGRHLFENHRQVIMMKSDDDVNDEEDDVNDDNVSDCGGDCPC